MASEPFRQLPFEEVPERPRVAHRWAETTPSTVEIETPDLGRVSIAVRTFGAGPPLLLIHGVMWFNYTWRYVLESLGAKFSLVMPDLPGAGHSDKPDVYLGPDVLARAIIAIAKETGTYGVPAIGNSMGGYLSMRAALLDPHVFSRLVNAHSPGVPTGRMHALRWAMKLLPSWTIFDRLIRRDIERWVHRQVHYYDESLKSKEEHRELAAPLSSREGRRGFYRHLRDGLDAKEMARFVDKLRAGPFPIPLQLVYADRDPVVPPVVGDRLRALVPAAEFVQLDRASHFAHVDAADRFVAAVLSFLTS
ncbi:MAG: alpha/beta hydrolase [Kofleriaceae bacterium]